MYKVFQTRPVKATGMWDIVQSFTQDGSGFRQNLHDFDLDAEMCVFNRKPGDPRRCPSAHTALTWSSWQGKLELVKVLIEEGADSEKASSQGLAAIHCAVMKGDKGNLEIVKFLLDYCKVDVDLGSGQDGATPLMLAAYFGSYFVCKILLSRRAEVNGQDETGRSALFYAVKGGHLDVVKLLVKHNACVYLRDNQGATVLHHLIAGGANKGKSMEKVISILEYLVEDRYLGVKTKMTNGSTPLHEACRKGLPSVVSFLIQKGAGLEEKKNGWETPLWSLLTSKRPNFKLIPVLFENGANFEQKHCLGLTAIQFAKQVAKNDELVRALEEAQKVQRAARMKALLAKRKQLLTDIVNDTEKVEIPQKSTPFSGNWLCQQESLGKLDVSDISDSSSDEDSFGGELPSDMNRNLLGTSPVSENELIYSSSSSSSEEPDVVLDINSNPAMKTGLSKQAQSCFDRLLKRKREVDYDLFGEKAVPQKITCVRRSAVSLSDSD